MDGVDTPDNSSVVRADDEDVDSVSSPKDIGTQITTKTASQPNRNAIKKKDGLMLNRVDIQYDVLELVFLDTAKVFTSPESKQTMTFKDLYIECISSSSRCTKVLKDKLAQDFDFAMAFSKLSLLVNIGRINTTLAFYPEMKTILRTFHAVPSLQYTESTKKHLQDAPRIKSILKGCVSPFDDPPTATLEGVILKRDREGFLPPTNVVNMGFVLFNCAPKVTELHFYDKFDFNDLFFEPSISSVSRYRAFMWLIYHYLEDPSVPNPWADPAQGPSTVPTLARLDPDDAATENIDTEKEIEYGEYMQEERRRIVIELASKTDDKPGKSSKGGSTQNHIVHLSNMEIDAPQYVSIPSKARRFSPTSLDELSSEEEAAPKKKKSTKRTRKEVEFTSSDEEEPDPLILPQNTDPIVDPNEDPISRSWKRIKDRDLFYDSDNDTDRETEYDNGRSFNALSIVSAKVEHLSSILPRANTERSSVATT